MRYWMVVLAVLASSHALASNSRENLMSAADISCASYLQMRSEQSTNMAYWVAGRIVAIAPATFQSSLAKIPIAQMQTDLQTFCQASSDATLFNASAILAYEYQRTSR